MSGILLKLAFAAAAAKAKWGATQFLQPPVFSLTPGFSRVENADPGTKTVSTGFSRRTQVSQAKAVETACWPDPFHCHRAEARG
jgi:hypothetical protein